MSLLPSTGSTPGGGINGHYSRRSLEGLGVPQRHRELGYRRVVAQDEIERSARRRKPIGFLVRARAVRLDVHRYRSVRVLLEVVVASEVITVDWIRRSVVGHLVIHRH